MADVEWQPLPALWPEPAVWTDVGELMLLVFTQDGVPTWEVNRRAKAGRSRDALIASRPVLPPSFLRRCDQPRTGDVHRGRVKTP
jgi:hypothetical protein